MTERVPDAQSERRLDAIRREAELRGRVDAHGVRPPGSPFPQATPETGYYGLPLLKPPVWTWEIPLYFFVGGAAGATAVFAAAASARRSNASLVRDGRRIAAVGAILCAPLLIADLGRPERFLNMLRVFKLQSPMSVGAWTVAVFGASASTAAFIELRPLQEIAGLVAAATGLVMATYTGVLLGATAIPVWAKNHALLPAHFGASATASAASILELRGHNQRALNALGFGAALTEVLTGARLLRSGSTGVTAVIADLLSGPVPLVLRAAGAKSSRARKAAAVCQLMGSILTRFAWVEAGRDSANASGPGNAISKTEKKPEPARKK